MHNERVRTENLSVGDMTHFGKVETKARYGPWMDITFVDGTQRVSKRFYAAERITVLPSESESADRCESMD